MSCKRWKRRARRWSYTEWSERDDGPWGGGHAAWAGGSYGPGYGFWGGRNFRILSGLRRDPAHGKVAGVCAGIGAYYGIRPKWIRIALILALVMNPPLTILGYAIATFLLHPASDSYRAEAPQEGGRSEMNAGTSAQRAAAAQAREKAAEEELPPELRFAALKDKFRELEGRTGEMEAMVTSPEFRLRRDFKQMGEGDAQGA